MPPDCTIELTVRTINQMKKFKDFNFSLKLNNGVKKGVPNINDAV